MAARADAIRGLDVQELAEEKDELKRTVARLDSVRLFRTSPAVMRGSAGVGFQEGRARKTQTRRAQRALSEQPARVLARASGAERSTWSDLLRWGHQLLQAALTVSRSSRNQRDDMQVDREG